MLTRWPPSYHRAHDQSLIAIACESGRVHEIHTEDTNSEANMSRSKICLAMLLATCSAAPAFAGTAITLYVSSGTPVPGKTSTVVAHLTGTHIVAYGGGYVPPGPVKFYANGAAIGTSYPAVGNSTGVACGPTGDPILPQICVASASDVPVAYTFPKGATATANFYAHFDGDDDYSGSSSPTLTVVARHRAISPIVGLLFDN